jgi:hypothetical protein
LLNNLGGGGGAGCCGFWNGIGTGVNDFINGRGSAYRGVDKFNRTLNPFGMIVHGANKIIFKQDLITGESASRLQGVADLGTGLMTLFGGEFFKTIGWVYAEESIISTEVAANTSTKLLGQPISQGAKQLEWIMAKHGPNQLPKYAGKSQFYISSQAELQTLIQNATRMPMTVQPEGNILRTVNAGRIIGFDAITGKFTSIYSVITNPNGNLITAFPGLP